MKAILLRTLVFIALPSLGFAQTPYESSADFLKYAEKLRESAIRKMEPQVTVPTESRMLGVANRYPWKTGIVTTIFSIEGASAWDPKWRQRYGGVDNPNPDKRHNFIPAGFVPRLNPFYIALPYNDVSDGKTTKPEAKVVIPWYKEAFAEEGKSVCRDRWVAIRNAAGKVCYAQWSDCGPFRSDHWQYVFGNEKPKPNANGGAGLNISPAVRDYLGVNSTDVMDWKFVEASEVPNGPWALYGENNSFLQQSRVNKERVIEAEPASSPRKAEPTPGAPSVIIPNPAN